MKVCSGMVSYVQSLVTAHGDQYAVWTNHIVTFRIGNQAVELRMRYPPQIANGDEVAVAGYIKGGILIARAFKNRSNGTYGKWRHHHVFVSLVAIVIVLYIGAFAAGLWEMRRQGVFQQTTWPAPWGGIAGPAVFGLIIAVVFGVGAVPTAIYRTLAARRTTRAFRLVKRYGK